MTTLFFKSDACVLVIFPAFTVSLEISVLANTVFNPRLYFENNTFIAFVFYDFNLRNMRILKING